MKSINIKTTLFASVIALVFTLIACNADSLLNDVNIQIGTELLYNPVNLQVLDARMDGTIPQNATVTIIGKDKDKVFSVLGEKTLKVNSQGIINIGIPRNFKPSIAAPLEFMVIVNAPNYLEARKSLTIGDITKQSLEQARMVNLASPPKGVSIESNTTISVNATTGVTQEIAFNTPTVTGKTEDATVKVASGTKMFDKDGAPVSGDIKVTLVHFDAVNESSISSFPGGLAFSNATDPNGNSLGSGIFTTFGFIAMNMTANGKEVKTFSQPLDMEIDINPNIYRPIYQRNVREGDTLPIWSMNETTSKWNAETYALIVNRNGKLKASFKQKHLSWWNIDDPSCSSGFWWNPPAPPCVSCNNPQVSILSDLPAGSPKSSFHVDIVSPTNPSAHVWNMGGDLTNLSNGTIIPFSNFAGGGSTNQNTGLVFMIYSKEPWNGGQLLYTSPTVYPCQNAVLDLRGKLPNTLIDPNKIPTINLNFSAVCSGSTTVTIYPTVTIYYKEVNVDVAWRVLGTISNGKGTTTGLIPGKKYKFAIFHGTLERTTDDMGLKDGFEMPSGDAVIPINSSVYSINETFTIRKEGNAYNLNYLNFPVPEKLCAEFKQYF